MTRRSAIVLVLIVVLVGCAPAKMSPSTESAAGFQGERDDGRVFVRSGSLSLRVKDLEATRLSLEEIAADVGARVAKWALQDDERLTMKLRVPEPQLERTMDRVAALGRVVGRSLDSEDVTEQLIDLEVRLRNLRALRDRLRSYLDQAATLDEILKVERELARVQSEIESIEAKLKVLSDKVAMSELDIWVKTRRWL